MSKLKITDKHFEQLKKHITEFCSDTLDSDIEAERESYLNQGFTVTRFNWDLCHAATQGQNKLWKELYEYLDDRHIDSALRVITGTNRTYN